VAINILLTVVQIIGAILSGSLALIPDAIHNLSDALSLVLAFLARKIARRPADDTKTFGYGRAEIVAALINYTTLILLGLYLTYEAVMRLFDPTDIDGWFVVFIAVFALTVDAVTALLTYALSKESMNIRAAFLHNVADALRSCSRKAIMSPLCNSGMSLSCSSEQREIGHGMGDDERARIKSHRGVGAGR
jgi:cobalt-zinc-cadmium efflux system protein